MSSMRKINWNNISISFPVQGVGEKKLTRGQFKSNQTAYFTKYSVKL